jgi:phosphoglycerol transferase MdoB-like AlkP superfamily enzyme
MSRRPAFVHAAIATWLVVWSRVLTATRPDGVGILDDASLVTFYTALQVGLAAWVSKRWLRQTLSVSLAALLALVVLTNQLFFSFFNTNLSLASLQLAGIAADAHTSITDLIAAPNLLTLLVLPIGAQLLALRGAARGSWNTGLTFFFAGLVLAGLASSQRQPVFLFSQHNPTMDLWRDATSRTLSLLGWQRDRELASRQDLLSLLNREGYPSYEPAGDASTPLWQRPVPGTETRGLSESRPNVVVILMESMRGLEMQGEYRALPVTPALNALERDGVVFSNFYANGMTTVDAEFSILCSALPVVNEAPVYIRKFDLDIRCLPEILKDHGYETHWISAYRANYANKRQFLERHGIDRVHDENSLDASRARHPAVGWGMGDVDMFDQALEKMDRFREPFFTELMTLSNHHPFDHDYDLAFPASFESLSGNTHYRNYLKGIYYTDHAVGRFLAAARERPWFSRTLFVILGDHAVRAYPNAPDGGALGPVLETEIYFRSRLLLYAPSFLVPDRHDILGSQIDVTPTILDLLGIRTPNSFLGVSLLADIPPARRFALMNIGHVFNIRSGNQYCYSVGYSCFEGVFPRCPPGVEPTSLGHTCFELEADLLHEAAGKTPRPLDPLERTRSLDRATRIMDLNRRLIEEDQFRPAIATRGSE